MVSVKPNIPHWNYLTSSCPTETISQHRAVIFGHALPPPGEDQEVLSTWWTWWRPEDWQMKRRRVRPSSQKNEYEKKWGVRPPSLKKMFMVQCCCLIKFLLLLFMWHCNNQKFSTWWRPEDWKMKRRRVRPSSSKNENIKKVRGKTTIT